MNNTRIIAFANHKGGVGKTTTVATLGALLSRRGLNVLMVDLDAQCNLTDFFLEAGERKSVYDSMVGKKGDFTVSLRTDLSLLPSSLDMSALDLMLAGRMERERCLQRILKRLDEQNHYDAILIDCPPSLGMATVNALVAATDLYVPTTAEYMPLKGLVMLQDICENIAQGLNPGIGISGIIITRFISTKKLSRAVEKKLRDEYSDIVFDTIIRENVKLAECPVTRKDIIEYAPESNGATDYLGLAVEVLTRLGFEQ